MPRHGLSRYHINAAYILATSRSICPWKGFVGPLAIPRLSLLRDLTDDRTARLRITTLRWATTPWKMLPGQFQLSESSAATISDCWNNIRYYPEPKAKAQSIKGYVAFYKVHFFHDANWGNVIDGCGCGCRTKSISKLNWSSINWACRSDPVNHEG